MRSLGFTWISIVLLFSNLLKINTIHALGHCLPDQKTILLQIQSNLTYDSSAAVKLADWDEGVDCCKWEGVSCNAAGYISGLDLSIMSITGGNLAESIGNLKMLSHIDLSGCHVSGSIPATIGNLTKLVDVRLSLNRFSGPIPSFKLAKNLTFISLSGNDFKGEIPSSHWDGLDNLVNLYLDNNSFSGPIPKSVFFLQSLAILDLSRNKFSGVQMTDLQNVTSPLEGLDLGSNNLEGPIPPFLFRLRNLISLSLSSNRFNGTVHLTEFINLENMVSLDLSHNSLVVETSMSTGELPILPQFESLWLASCNIQKFPSFLENQDHLMMLDLSNNAISGEIPEWLWGMSRGELRYLNLSHNHFTRVREPNEYGRHDYMDLHSNLLSGQIPRLPRAAAYLDLSGNNFSSVIPLDIGDQLPNVRFFSIANNRVSGSIPPSLCHQPYLEVLDLSNNSLQGTIPSCLTQNNSHLAVINLRGNRLSGTIPQTFIQGCSLETLDLSQNLLEGRVPSSLLNCPKLKVLNFGNNILIDTFPCWLNKLSNLHILVLRSNHFRGSISCSGLGVNNSWLSLQVIDLSSNNFTGILPVDLFLGLKAIAADVKEAQSKVNVLHFSSPEVGNVYYQDSVWLSLKGQNYNIEKILSVFTSIDLSSNRFQGSIPEAVGVLKQLHLLNISCNVLTGNIPRSLENLKELEALDLSINDLTGHIPEQLETLTFLSFLNVSYNRLVGRIPRGGQLDTFDRISFMGNKGLCGFQLNVSCRGTNEAESPQPQPEEQQLGNYGDICTSSIILGFVAGLGAIFLPILASNKWRSYCNKKIDGILSNIFS